MRKLLIVLALLLAGLTFVRAQDAGVVQVSTNPTLGTILVAPNGMTLYTFANDQPGVSNCVGQCLELWPAYTVDGTTTLVAGAGVTGELNVIVQPDGRLHVTFNGSPLYFYSGDAAPGDVTGQGVGNVWFAVPVVAAAPPVVLSEFLLNSAVDRDLGSYLTASNGMTLYTFSNDTPGVSNCVGQCLELWPPFTADAAAVLNAAPGIVGTIATIARPDGLTQVTLDNRPLYFYTGDTAPGDVTGQGVGNVWFSLPLDLVRVGGTPERPILVTSSGRTLYTFANDEFNWSNCTGDCAVNWPPLALPAELPIISSMGADAAFRTSLRADGTYHVTFNSRPLYTFSADLQPGDVNGDGAGGVWSVAAVTPVVQLGGNAAQGSFLADMSFRTLYVFANDTTPGTSACVDGCAANWPPLTIPAGASPVAQGYLPGTLGTIQRPDGSTQVTLDGRPVYRFANDANPGDANGDGVGGVWSLVRFDFPFEGPATCSVTPVNQAANLRQSPTTGSATIRSAAFGETLVVAGQAQSEGYVWWQLATGEWVRSDVVSEVTPCAGMPVIQGVGVPAPAVQPAGPVGTQEPAPPPAPPAPAETQEPGG